MKRDQVKINKYGFFHCKLIANTNILTCVGNFFFYTRPLLANLFS